MSGPDQSTKLFNTAIIATKIPTQNNYSAKLNELVHSRAFQSVLQSIRELARNSGISEELAAEEIIITFREIDKVWDSYIFHEGLEKLKGHLSN
jgi:hypothetical protein